MRFNKYSTTEIKYFHSTVPAGKRSYREHHHTECELSLFLSGKGIYTTPDKEISFEADDIFLFASDEIHCITEISGDTPFELINIHFEPRIIWDNNFNSDILLNLFNNRSKSFSNKIDNLNPSSEIIRNKIINIKDEFTNKPLGYELNIKLELFNILMLLLRDYNYVKNIPLVSKDTDIASRLSLAIDYINNHLTENITLSDISNAAALSKTYFSTLFKKYNGISPWDYITIKRVEKAIQLIKTSDMNKLEIAEECGFSSSSNFYKAFTKITNKNPSDYKK